ncbi:MAG: CBS domain-containing protein [Spirochaetia bacterium]|nr:CBS domain-containing protein [Spirochaetia bacterium]
MKLSSLVRAENIILKSNAVTKKQAIDEMYALLSRRYKLELADVGDAGPAIWEREELGGTVFPAGIAIPHARLDNFDDLIISICVPANPIRCDNIDVKIFILILTSKTVSNTYLNALSTFMKMSRNKELFNRWISCEDPESMIEFFDSNDIKIKKELTIEDIMSTDVVSVKEESSLREVIDIFYKHNLGFMPVLDDNGKFIGEVNLINILKKSVPDYAIQMANLKFMKSFEPLERLFREEDAVTVSEIMVPPTITFTRDMSLLEATLDFITNNRRQIPVVEGQRIVGIVSLKDILQKVLRS